ncbi:zinc finger MYM-type protein 1-like, partial [Aphis gossypii]|uniref:zinc finger MYM-type protein 1-like n=1 Tax=Aphis gossypii TaxID=80765 RepID=UPI0021590BDA
SNIIIQQQPTITKREIQDFFKPAEQIYDYDDTGSNGNNENVENNQPCSSILNEIDDKYEQSTSTGATESNKNTENLENNHPYSSNLNEIDDNYEQSTSTGASESNKNTKNVENNQPCSSILNEIDDNYEQSTSTGATESIKNTENVENNQPCSSFFYSENITFPETLCISTPIQSNLIYENDPAKFHTFINIIPEFTDMIVRKGPCQPTNNVFKYPTNEEHRSFQESWFTKKLNDGTLVNRDWLSYSISIDKMFCFHCQIFGRTKRDNWVINGVSKWKNTLHKMLVHETSSNHIDASLKFKLRNQVLPILPSLTEKRKFEVLCNRGIVKELIDITLFLSRHSLAFRGHREKWSDSLRGNFKDLWSFISWRRQNELVECISDEIVGIISKSIKDSPFFSVSLDTTFDVSRKEQLSFIVRYIDQNSGSIYERLIAVLETPITTGCELMNVFRQTCDSLNLDWKHHLVGQSYDGAANMRGNYNGLQSLIKEINPHAIYVWCWAHRLNLVITDVVSSGINAMDMFGNLEKLYDLINSSKIRVKYYEQFQKERYKKKQIRRIKRVTTTRWMSFSYALDVVLSTYLAVLDTLEIMRSTDGLSDRKSGFEAGAILDYLKSYRFVWTALTFKKIFDILSPTSSILQSKDLDLMLAVSMIEQNKIKISKLRSDESFENLSQEVDAFVLEQADENEESIQLPTPRLRKKKKMSGELSDDELILDPIQNIKVNTYFSALDIVQRQLSERFSDQSIGVLKDLSLLTSKVIYKINQDPSSLPKDSFKFFLEIYGKFVDKKYLCLEYLQFASFFNTLITSEALPNTLHSKSKEIFGSESEPESDDESDEEDSNSENIVSNIKNNSGSLQPIFQIFLNKGLKSVFPNVYIMLKIGLTLPVTSASPERAFSKLKIVKNRLRSTMGQERLQGLMRITCEKDLTINYENIINTFASKSPHLLKALVL